MANDGGEQVFPVQARRNRHNYVSIRYRASIDQLLVDDTIENFFDNLYFCRNRDNYIIGNREGAIVYLGLMEECNEVAIKEIKRDQVNITNFNVQSLQDSKRESKYIVRYVKLAKTDHYYYVANQLCEYNLEDYMEFLRANIQRTIKQKNVAREKIVKEVLYGLQVLHCAGVEHCNLKPGNVLIDSQETVKLDYFCGSSTTSWEATEILNRSEEGHTKSSDIQVAGMLVYYILSDGQHPFGEIEDRERNIRNGEYFLEHERVEDSIAKDLIEWMINKDPIERPTIDEVLKHPYFWDNNRKDVVLRRLGDREEVQQFKNNDANIYKAAVTYTNENVASWKSQLKDTWDDIDKKLPDNLLGLLRFLRNKLVHKHNKFLQIFIENNLQKELLDDFYIGLYKLAKDQKWKY